MEKSEAINGIIKLQHQLARHMRSHAVEHWKTINLGISQVKALFCLVENRDVSSSKMAEILGVTPANVTGIVDRLIEQGLVQRVASAEDRRVTFLEPTPEGKRLIENLEQHVSERSTMMLSGMTEAELEHLYLGLKAFLRVSGHPSGENCNP